MLRITKLTDYAIVLLAQLSPGREASGSAHPTRELASRTGLPQPTASKILKDLARAGIVVSQRGVQGGYRLARSPEAISVADIIDAVDGPIALTECSTGEPDSCALTGACSVEASWIRINDVVRSALSGISLAEMARPSTPQLVHLRRSRPSGSQPEKLLDLLGATPAERHADAAPESETRD